MRQTPKKKEKKNTNNQKKKKKKKKKKKRTATPQNSKDKKVWKKAPVAALREKGGGFRTLTRDLVNWCDQRGERGKRGSKKRNGSRRRSTCLKKKNKRLGVKESS